MNAFDAAVYILTALAVIMGFSSGLLRSLATIFAYAAAAAITVAAAPSLTPIVTAQVKLLQGHDWTVPVGLFLISGFFLGAALRFVVSELIGSEVGIADRMAGAFFGAVRIVLLAVLMVLIFDRIVPADRQPAFLADSKLRPILLAAGQQGLRSLPPDLADAIDRLKREHGL